MKLLIALLIGAASVASGQSMLEYSLGTGATRMGAEGMRNAGQSIGGIFDSLNRALVQTTDTAVEAPVQRSRVSGWDVMPERRPVDPELLNKVMPDAKILIGLHVDRILASPLGEMIKAQMQQSQPEIQKQLSASGLNPLADLHEILIASPGGERNPPMLVLIRGSLDPSGLITPDARLIAEEQGVQIYGHEGTEESPIQALALLDSSTVAAGDQQAVTELVRAGGANRGLPSELRESALSLSAGQDIWITSEISMEQLGQAIPDNGASADGPAAWGSIRQFRGGLRLDRDLQFSANLVTHGAEDANELAAGLRMLTGLMQAKQSETGSDMGAMLAKNLTMTVNGNAVSLSLMIPEAELQQSLQERTAPVTSESTAPRPNRGLIIQSSPSDMGTVEIPLTQPQ